VNATLNPVTVEAKKVLFAGSALVTRPVVEGKPFVKVEHNVVPKDFRYDACRRHAKAFLVAVSDARLRDLKRDKNPFGAVY